MTAVVAGLRISQARQVLLPLGRLVRWDVLALATLGSAVLLGWQHDRLEIPSVAMWMLRAVTLLLAGAVAFAVDDPARAGLGAVPTPLWWRYAARIGLTVLPAGAVWGLAAAWAGSQSARPLPYGDLALESGALWTATVAIGAALARWRDVPEPGVYVAPAVLVIGLFLPQLPAWIAMVPWPGPEWDPAHVRIAGLLVVAWMLLAAALTDPARRLRGS